MRPLSRAAAVLCLLAASAAAQVCPLGPTKTKIVSCRPGVSLSDCRRVVERVGCAVKRELPSIRAVVVEIPEPRVAAADIVLRKTAQVEFSQEDERVHWLAAGEFELPASAASLGAAAAALRGLPRAGHPVGAPALQAFGRDSEQTWGLRRLDVGSAWPVTEGRAASVAVLDSGIDASHPDLAGQVEGGVNIIEPQNDWRDDNGHGTHVAGTIAAKRDGKGVAGVAPGARVWAVKVVDRFGNGTVSELIAGLEWAAARGIPIANVSLSANAGGEALRRAVAAATEAGTLVVASAGNKGGALGFPAAFPEALSVGAIDNDDRVAKFSNKGPELDLVAPGVGVLSTSRGGGHAAMTGTSMAAPHVSGLAALAYSFGRRGAALRSALEGAASRLGMEPAESQGRGLVSAKKLVK